MNNTADTSDRIGLDRAKELVLAHAGVAADQVTFIEAYEDYDDGRAEYDIEFICGNTKYEYEIDAVLGDVLSYEAEEVRR